MDVYLTFDVIGEERPKIGGSLQILRISNDPNTSWFPRSDNYVNYGKVVKIEVLPDEGGELRTACLTRVSRRRYERLISKEDFGEYAIKRSASSVGFTLAPSTRRVK